jgi:hypothetical protein
MSTATAPDTAAQENGAAKPVAAAGPAGSSRELLKKLLPDGHVPGVNGEADFDMTSKDYYFNSYAHFGIHGSDTRDSSSVRSSLVPAASGL